jgi:hypothetical protein
LVALAGVLVFGAFLRLLWVDDIEYKMDEAWTFNMAQEARHSGVIPALGMPTSAGPLNPGFSLWIYIGLAELGAVVTPQDLARMVQCANIGALLFLMWFAWKVVPRREREIWLWATALVAVNPLAVLFERKIWPPSVFPLFSMLFLLGWWYRRQRMAALLWGLIGALLGQINVPGFFFAAGFAIWAFLFDRRRVAWSAWLTGSVIGVLPMLPWLDYLWNQSGLHNARNGTLVHLVEGKFWLRWVLEPLGLGLDYSLGADFADFMRYPLVRGSPTYLMVVAQLTGVTAGAIIFWMAGQRLWKRKTSLVDCLVGRDSPSAFTVYAALWGFGLLLTLSAFSIHRHYMIVLYPLQFVWVARLALGPLPGAGRRYRQRGGTGGASQVSPGRQYLDPLLATRRLRLGRALLAILLVSQGLLSWQFLAYVHRGASVRGDYGPPLQAQDETMVEQWKAVGLRPQ